MRSRWFEVQLSGTNVLITVLVVPEIIGGVAYVGVGSGADIEGGGATDSVEELT